MPSAVSGKFQKKARGLRVWPPLSPGVQIASYSVVSGLANGVLGTSGPWILQELLPFVVAERCISIDSLARARAEPQFLGLEVLIYKHFQTLLHHFNQGDIATTCHRILTRVWVGFSSSILILPLLCMGGKEVL
jgi:hypothetical protein